MANKLTQRGLGGESTVPESTALSSGTPRKLTQRPEVAAILPSGPRTAAATRQPFAQRVLGVPEGTTNLLGYEQQLGVVNEYLEGIRKLSQRPEVLNILPDDQPGAFFKKIEADPIFGQRLQLARQADTAAAQAQTRSRRALAQPSLLRAGLQGPPGFEERPRLRGSALSATLY